MSGEPERSSEHHGLHHTPTHSLPHERKLARQRPHIRRSSPSSCVLVLAALVYAAAFDLNSSPSGSSSR